MDASIFYFVALELASKIQGLRIEKVFSPLPKCWTIALGRAGFLVIYIGRPQPFFFLSEEKPENPAQPSGQAMWLRKRLKNRRIVNVVLDWPRRRMAWELSPGEGSWLVLGLQASPSLVDTLPTDFGLPPLWPDVETIIHTPRIWETHPHLSSFLRHFLASLPLAQAQDFLSRLQTGSFETFYMGEDYKKRLQLALWPLANGQHFFSALEAARHWGQGILADLVQLRSGQDTAKKRTYRRIERNLQRLQDDEVRLQRMIERRKDALDLQNILYTIDKNSRFAEIPIRNMHGQTQILTLDPALTVLENMTRLFARAAKGERGLPLVAARRKALEDELKTVRSQEPSLSPLVADPAPDRSTIMSIPARYQGIKAVCFRSSDGFLLFRGRSAQANHQLLTRAATPFDLWLHAQNGPGAHVIIKRDFSTQEVPERTILEAAGLAALASHLKMAGSGDVVISMVRDVRTIKGAALGMVDVTKVLRVVRVRIDPALEDRLQLVS